MERATNSTRSDLGLRNSPMETIHERSMHKIPSLMSNHCRTNLEVLLNLAHDFLGVLILLVGGGGRREEVKERILLLNLGDNADGASILAALLLLLLLDRTDRDVLARVPVDLRATPMESKENSSMRRAERKMVHMCHVRMPMTTCHSKTTSHSRAVWFRMDVMHTPWRCRRLGPGT